MLCKNVRNAIAHRARANNCNLLHAVLFCYQYFRAAKLEEPVVKKIKPVRLSSRWLGEWRQATVVIYTLLVLAIGWSFLSHAESTADWILGIGQCAIYVYAYVLGVRATRNLVQAAFDDEFLYVQLKDQELLIPLENIKDVEIKTLGGTYEVKLYSPEQLGDTFYFKVSLLYPLNHRSKEALVDRLWSAIEKAKRKKQDFLRNALMS